MQQRIRYEERPTETLAILQEYDGRKWLDTACVVHIDHARAQKAMEIFEAKERAAGRAIDDTSGFGDRFKRFVKRVAKNKIVKVVTAPVTLPAKWAHKVTHTGPLGKLHDQVQGFVAKQLPFTKPFIKFHNRAASFTERQMAAAGMADAKRKVTAKAIIEATKKLPASKRKAAQKALVKLQKSYTVIDPSGRTFEGITLN